MAVGFALGIAASLGIVQGASFAALAQLNPDAEDRALAAEERDYYTMANVFWVPATARWEAIRAQAKQAEIGMRIDAALEAITNGRQAPKAAMDGAAAQATGSWAQVPSAWPRAMGCDRVREVPADCPVGIR